jgi:putative effector of murein hydrolase
MAVIVGGFFFTLWTTAGSIVQVSRKRPEQQQQYPPEQDNTNQTLTVNTTATATIATTTNDSDVVKESATLQIQPSSPPPFSDTLMKNLRIASIFSGLAALEGASPAFTSLPAKILTQWQTPLLSLHLLLVTLTSFCYGARMLTNIQRIVHPLVTCTTLTWAVMGLFGKCTGRTFSTMLSSYRRIGSSSSAAAGSAATAIGAGDILLFLLGPAVISLAISMYDKRQLLRDHAKEVATGVVVSSVGGLLGTALMVRFMNIQQPSIRIALLSRNITSPLAMAIATILGASSSTISLAVSIVVVTGLIGANFGATILDKMKIVDNPVARGMGIGAAAHGLGTAALVQEKDAFPFAAISMALTATACTVLVSIPIVQKLVLSIALGSAAGAGAVVGMK